MQPIILPSTQVAEGDGSFIVKRPFPAHNVQAVDPFLLLDHFGPREVPANSEGKLPPHPHRGFETLTYVISGALEHGDSEGNHGVIGPGEVQWMTAGSGIIHTEQPGEDLRRNGGTLEGFQLWLNLPAQKKMTPPRYQELKGDDLPVVQLPDGAGHMRVIAGEFFGAQSKGQSHTGFQIAHITLIQGGAVYLPVNKGYSVTVYVVRGSLTYQAETYPAGTCLVLGLSAGMIPLACGDEEAELMLLAGAPIGEPIVRGGPFVMNTRSEVLQAFEDFQNGTLQNTHKTA